MLRKRAQAHLQHLLSPQLQALLRGGCCCLLPATAAAAAVADAAAGAAGTAQQQALRFYAAKAETAEDIETEAQQAAHQLGLDAVPLEELKGGSCQ